LFQLIRNYNIIMPVDNNWALNHFTPKSWLLVYNCQLRSNCTNLENN